MIRRLLPFFALGLMFPLGGCVSSSIQEIREAETGLTSEESIVLIGRRTLPNQEETEHSFVSCLSRRIGGSSGGKPIKVIAEDDFRDALFPWFEPRTAPTNSTDLPALMAQPHLAARLNELGLRYLVWIAGDTDRTDSGGSMTCSVTTAGAGCFGFLTWENSSAYEASIWDIKTGASVGRISSDAVGTSYMPAVVVPLPLIARVRSSACNTLADQLKSFLTATD
jgi:hypothetical protein